MPGRFLHGQCDNLNGDMQEGQLQVLLALPGLLFTQKF